MNILERFSFNYFYFRGGSADGKTSSQKKAPSRTSTEDESIQFEKSVRYNLTTFQNLRDEAKSKDTREIKYYEISLIQDGKKMSTTIKNDIEWKEKLQFGLGENTFFNVVVQKMKEGEDDKSKESVILHFLDWKDEYRYEQVFI
jgi:hypothetical protein